MRHLQRASAIGILVTLLGAGHPSAEAATMQVVTLRGRRQTLHLYGPRGGRPVIVSSGDGGWIHLGPQIADALAGRGYFVIGFDVKAYLSSFTSGDAALRVEDEPEDYLRLVQVAATNGRGRPVLLGVSEGGALSVLAASDGSVRAAIRGVIALGLGDVNELAWRWRDSIIYLTHGVPEEPTFSVASIIAKVAPSPLAMIHSIMTNTCPPTKPGGSSIEPGIRSASGSCRPITTGSVAERMSSTAVWSRRSHGFSKPGPPATGNTALPRSPTVWRRLTPFIGLALFLIALWVLDRELQAIRFQDLTAELSRARRTSLMAALALTALNYLVLTCYDQLAFVYVRRKLSRSRIALASFVGYALSNSIGFAMISGASARYRFYSRWGLSGEEISRIVLFYTSTFWLGLFVLGGWSLIATPAAAFEPIAAKWIARGGGALLLATACAYLVAPLVWRRPLRVRGFDFSLPSPRLVVAQVVLSTVDWGLAVAVLYVLLPEPRPPFLAVVAAFLAAQLLGLASHVPGGVGVFETLMLLLLRPAGVTAQALLPALVVFRVIYYVLPLAVGLVVLLGDELLERRAHLARATAMFGRLADVLAPRVLAAFTFLAGAVLLASGATPAASGRLAWLGGFVPLPIIEVSHFAGSVLGAGLLLVSQGLARRLDAAYVLAANGLALGIVASLLKAADYEEAALLAFLLGLLLPARRTFHRKARLFDASLSASWLLAVGAVVAASVWLGAFAFRHVQYASELWWQFELDREASRFLRASTGAVLLVLVVAARYLLHPARPALPPPSDADLEAVADVIASQDSTMPFLVYLRDKALLWNDERTGFVMYGVQGSTWVALGDPVGPPDAIAGLVQRFLERCDDFGATPVLYEVRTDWLHHYADYGLTFAKLGEEARVRLDQFSLEGGRHKKLRMTTRRLAREGATFRVVPPRDLPPLLPELRRISDDWLRQRGAAEKGFSLGFFDERYLSRFPIAVIEHAVPPETRRVEAFANLWPGRNQAELSLDLMRHRADAVKDVMDGLFVNLMLWAKEQGYRWMNLGMAPLSGLPISSTAPLWARAANLLYTRGEALYNFQGLRAYKDKFDPIWEPRYLVYPGGLSLPRVLADVSALVAGGYLRIFTR
jgi:phosphatidylglycerol lysyltransferase